MKTLQHYLSLFILTSVIAYAGGNIVKEEAPAPIIPVVLEETNPYFVYLAGGVAYLSGEDTLATGNTFTAGALDDEGSVYELGVGYRYTDNIFATLAVQRTTLDIADIDNIYASINYQFSDVMLKPYIGLVAGYSKLEWSEAPHVVLSNKDLDSDGAMYGVQAGLEFELSTNWSVFGKYQFITYDHLMDIRNNASTIEHKDTQNLLLGVRYGF